MSVINSDSVRAGASGAVTAAYTIEQSCRFNDDDSAHLARTPLVAGNTRTWTFSAWVKRGNLGSADRIFEAFTDSNNYTYIQFQNATDVIEISQWSGSYDWQLDTTQVFRDPSAWYHIVVGVDTTHSTASSRVRLYINGTEVTAFGVESNPAQNFETDVNATVKHNIAKYDASTGADFDGYMADIHLIDGAQLAATSFGETDDQGNWVPIEYAGTDGADVALSFVAAGDDPTNSLADYSGKFDGFSIGTAHADRKVFVAINGRHEGGGGRTVSSCTVGGVTAKELVQANASGARTTAIFMAPVPSGTTADIDIVFSGNQAGCGIATYESTTVGQDDLIQLIKLQVPVLI